MDPKSQLNTENIFEQVLLKLLNIAPRDGNDNRQEYQMGGGKCQKFRVGCGAVFNACDVLESYDLACSLAELFLLADSPPTLNFC